MREIKFRIFNKHTEQMIYDNEMAMRNLIGNGSITEDEHRYIMQFTGLYDVNGTEIYEGDETNFGVVSYYKGSFIVGDYNDYGNWHTLHYGHYKGVKVIGNIHD